MKQYYAYLSAILILITSLSISAQDGLRPRGDVNCDWNADVLDVVTLIHMVLDNVEYHSLYTYAADINGDKLIDVGDITRLIDGVLNSDLSPMPSYSGTLPVLFINTEGHQDIVSKEEYLSGTWWLDNMGIDSVEAIGSAEAPLGLEIKGRGNSTWTKPDKKPYRLKFDEKHKMIGMTESRHWVLLANVGMWMGQMNDALPFEIGRRMGMSWNPHIEPVEVVLNGQYIGLYFLTEKIRVDKDRVNITEQDDGETDPDKITGGWLLELDNYSEPDYITITEKNGQRMKFTSHSPDVLSAEQRSYITTFLTQADRFIYTNNKNLAYWTNYIDIDSLAIYYIVQEAVDNPEAFSGSCYMHKQRGNGTKLIFGPMWDCGSSFYRYNKTYPFNDFIYENLPSYCRTHWIAEIAKYPHFQARVKYHWQRFYNEVYPQMDDYIDQFTAKIQDAGNADYIRWPQNSGKNTVQRANRYLKPCFHKKVAWLQTQWGD